MKDGLPIKIDSTAESTSSSEPAFLAPPPGAPVYHGFPLLPETETDGWVMGVITGFEDPNGCEGGDAFVVAPDGSRAGLIWEVGELKLSVVEGPNPRRWGVFQVGFPKAVKTLEDMTYNFRLILPLLKAKYAEKL